MIFSINFTKTNISPFPFINQMGNISMIKILVLLMFSSLAYGQGKTISCANDTCVTNFMAQTQLEKPFYSAIDIGPNNENITVTVPTNQTPRSVRLNVKNGANPRNLLLDLSSQRSTANAGSTLVIGDMFNNLEIRMNGYNGRRGKDASQICAERVKDSRYGDDARIFFEQRRASDPSLNPNRCDRIDLSYLQNFAFTCDDSTYSELPGLNPVVEVKRMRFKARCTGVLVQDLCLKRKQNVTCIWQNYSWACSKRGCSKRYNSNLIYTRRFGMDEEFVKAEINTFGQTVFCQRHIGRPGGDYDLYISGAPVITPYTSPGTDVLFNPLPGSIWERYRTQAYGKCNQYWTTMRTESVIKVAYDESGTDCDRNSVGIPEDPNRVIPWAYSGMAQEPEFGTEMLQCAVGECPVNSTLSDLERNLDLIVPESGDNGTQQGNGVALIYDTAALAASATLGQAGAAGLADLDSPESTKFCGKIRDADSDGITSEFARNPSVSFRRYRWKAIRTAGGGNNGVQPPASTNNVEVYRKIDSSARFLLSKELL